MSTLDIMGRRTAPPSLFDLTSEPLDGKGGVDRDTEEKQAGSAEELRAENAVENLS